MTDLYSDLQLIIGDLSLLIPQLVVVGTVISLILIDLIFAPKNHLLSFFSGLGILLSIFLSYNQFISGSLEDAFQGMITMSNLTAFWHIFLSTATILIVLMSANRVVKRSSMEFYVLTLGILVGSHFLVMSSNMLMLYFSLEVISLCSYALTFFAFDKLSSEASLKYLLFGATASAIMLYGMSLVFAIAGTLDFTGQEFIDNLLAADGVPVTVASILVLSGFLFKISAVPFHAWVPDVYETAPTPVVAFFSVVPKIAGLAILIKVILAFNLFGQSPINWSTLLSVIAILTITVGNFSAIWQNNVKRLLAYSAIAQTGFLLAGLSAFSETSLTNVVFYAVTYALAGTGAFFIIHFFERKYGLLETKSYSGLIYTHPFQCILFLIAMISLTGLPPTAGFTAKFLIFSSIWESYNYSENGWLLVLLVFGLANTVVALFYYLKVPYYMIFRPITGVLETGNNFLKMENYLGALLVLALLVLFFRPDWLMGIINSITFAF